MRRSLRFWPLLTAIYFCVSGGPFGLEPVFQAGKGLGLLLVLITPLVWAAPAALMSAELTSAIPAEGGYYVWVKRALGPFAGYLCAIWTWIYAWIDVAIYPGLFAASLANLLDLVGVQTDIGTNPLHRWLAGLIVIVPFTLLNILGIKKVGNTSVALFVLLLLPFVFMVAIGLPHLFAAPAQAISPMLPPDSKLGGSISIGLFAVIWNYLGWDSMTSVAGEVDSPTTSYPKALTIGVLIVTLSYLLPSLVGLAHMPDLADWKEGAWSAAATKIGGRTLGVAVASAGMLSAAGLFSATLLASSRMPFVLAEDRLMPHTLTKLHRKFGTPVGAILVSALFYTMFSSAAFESLTVIDVILYSSALLLEFAALIVLRKKEPDLARPFRIGGGWPAVLAVAIVPSVLIVFAIWSQWNSKGPKAILFAAIAMSITALAYPVAKRLSGAFRA